MSPQMIILLVQTLGPILLPLVSAGATWAFDAIMGLLNVKVQKQINPFLPIVSTLTGVAVATMSGIPASEGAVGGLAGTGLHQIYKQTSDLTEKKGRK